MHVRWLLDAIVLGGVLWAAPAQAQVYEINPQGALMIRDGGGAVQWRAALAPAPLPTSPDAAPPIMAPPMAQAMARAAAHHGISPLLLEAVVWQESRWHPDAVSPKGARGLTQLMPDTARSLRVDPRDPASSLDGGAHYLRLMLDHFDGDVELALAAYNAGPARVERTRGIPAIAETRNYVTSIMNRLGGHALRSCVNVATCAQTLP